LTQNAFFFKNQVFIRGVQDPRILVTIEPRPSSGKSHEISCYFFLFFFPTRGLKR